MNPPRRNDFGHGDSCVIAGQPLSLIHIYGMEALDIVSTQSIQLIILDIMMPKLDGLSATMKIRQSKNIPIIILSAKTEESDKILGLSMGADDYITKPYSPCL